MESGDYPAGETASHRTTKGYETIFRWSLYTWPYLYYISLCSALVVVIYGLRASKEKLLDPFTCKMLLLITGLLVLSAIFAFNKGEAFLQLSNFLPFFLLFAASLRVLNSVKALEKLALGLVIAAIPINLISLAEYGLKSPDLPQFLQTIGAIAQLRAAPHVGRAMVTFDHPNVLASYLVMILGLGLGLILNQARPQEGNPQLTAQLTQHRFAQFVRQPQLLYLGTYLNLVGIFCSGSRNGLLIAISQLVLFSLFVKTRRIQLFGGLLGAAAIALVALVLGIGGREASLGSVVNDPRVGVWQIALDLMRDRPWLGWGLGNYKLLYPERLIDPTQPYIAHPHNLWLLLGSEAGIPVMLLMTVFVGCIGYRAVRLLMLQKRDSKTRGVLLGYLFAFWGCIGFALFDITFYDAGINMMNWTLLAGIYSASGLESSTPASTPKLS